MKAYVITLTAIAAIEIFCALFVLGTGKIPERTTGTVAINAALWVGLAGWGIYLLTFKGP